MQTLNQQTTRREKLSLILSSPIASLQNKTARYFISCWNSITTTWDYFTETLLSTLQITPRLILFRWWPSNCATSRATFSNTFSQKSTAQTFSGVFVSLASFTVLLTREAFCRLSSFKMGFWLSLTISLSTSQYSMKTTSFVLVYHTFKSKIFTATWSVQLRCAPKTLNDKLTPYQYNKSPHFLNVLSTKTLDLWRE